MWQHSRELFLSDFVLFTCISTHNLWKDKGSSSPGTSFGKTKHTSWRGLLQNGCHWRWSWALDLDDLTKKSGFIYFNKWNPYPFIYLKPGKGTPFGRHLPVSEIIGSTLLYYIHTEKYSPKSYVVHFRTQISSSQSEERTMVFTCEKNDTSNQNRERCFFTCEKNDMDACTNFDDANLSSRRDDQVGDYVCECWWSGGRHLCLPFIFLVRLIQTH